MTAGEAPVTKGGTETMLDLVAAGWRPGESCPECDHQVVHAIVRAGVTFRSDGS